VYVETDGLNQIVRIEPLDTNLGLEYYTAKEGNVGRVYEPQNGGKIFQDVTKATDTVFTISKEHITNAAGKAGEQGEYISATKATTESPNKTIVDALFDKNGNLLPDVRYEAGEFRYNYETDSRGRLESYSTDNLQLTERTERLHHEPNTPGKLPGDHAGHLAADIFGGSPKLDNLVSQLSKVNQSEYRAMEIKWAKAIRAGKKVQVRVDIGYIEGSTRPAFFKIKYMINGEKCWKILKN